MYRRMLKSKIHRARITGCELHYEGSIAIDESLLRASNILPFEQVDVYNVNNGARFSTYVIPAPPGSGEVRLNGAAARLGMPGDIVIIASYCMVDEVSLQLGTFRPVMVYVNEDNRITSVKEITDLWAGLDFSEKRVAF
ncbi:aspartate 1-decarboxylase [Thermocrinis albus DSM 14484]|uniref:Aspartate 1-decarboxylase n=1 Tax=Thermocrinis albus (strain DSM 14484 / JCM 11386 / HI 11/12) TaxID=638303 RepID=D3SQ83_THEAH|nr:aspartate 1-decarboxylase [Thermocrinis albus]ADC89320.1 aspartate 1-decarboxylase [Thermocrinis albus DSM 14484]